MRKYVCLFDLISRQNGTADQNHVIVCTNIAETINWKQILVRKLKVLENSIPKIDDAPGQTCQKVNLLK